MKIKATFGLLDISTGRKALERRIKEGHDLDEPVEVIIHAFITHRSGTFDGVGQEFGLVVKNVRVCDGH